MLKFIKNRKTRKEEEEEMDLKYYYDTYLGSF